MDEEVKTTEKGASGDSPPRRVYSLEDILAEYGRIPVKSAEKPAGKPAEKISDKPAEKSAGRSAEKPAEKPREAEPENGDRQGGSVAVITGDDESGGIFTDAPEQEAPDGETPQEPEKAEPAAEEAKEPEQEPPISVSDFDEAYREQQKKIKQHRKLVLKSRLRNKRFRYIKTVQRITREASAAKRQSEKREAELLAGRDIGECISEYTSLSRSLAVRKWIALVLSLPIIYLSIASQAGFPLPPFIVYMNHPYMFLCAQIALLSCVMLCGLDVFTSGLRSIVKLRPDTDSLVFLSVFTCFLYNISVVLFPGWGGYISYSGVAALNMYFALLGKHKLFSARARALRSANDAKSPMAVVREKNAFRGMDCIAKVKTKGISGFIRGLEEQGLSSRLISAYSAAASVGLAVIAVVCMVWGEGERTLFYVSSVSAMLPACGLVIGYYLPYGRVSKRLLRDGVAVGGSEGLKRLDVKGCAILTDSDFFGSGSVILQGYKLFGETAKETAITYTASILSAAGCGIARQFEDLAIREFCTLVEPKEMEYSDYGGIKAVIGYNHVMVGTASYMYRMGLRPPSDVKLRTGVFCAVNMEIIAVFALRYMVNETHRHWINLLVATKRRPVLASRDFNVTPALVDQRFRIKPGHIIYPEIENRLELNSTTRSSDGSFGLLVLRDTLESYVGSIEGCRRLNRIARVNGVIGVISSAFGASLVAYLLFSGAYVSVSPLNVLYYSLLWAIPVFLLSGWVTRY